MNREIKETSLVFITLLTSMSTLICCTLPIVFVVIGLGTVFTTLIMQWHWWITLAKYKFWLFVISGIMLLLTYLVLNTTNSSCPVDSELGALCKRIRRWNIRILQLSFVIWTIGFVSAYLALPIYEWLGN